MKKIFQNALKEKYALGAFNFVNLEMLKAIINASLETDFPVIASVSEGALKYMGIEETVGMFKAAKKNAKVFLHLDHGKNLELIKRTVDLGFDSVMIDASSFSFEENVKQTKEVVNYAHKKDVLVEAELGTLAGIEDEVKAEKNIYTDPNEAKKFVELTNCDSLAVAIGTSHGAYKFSGDSKLNMEILSEIETLIPNTPLVLHGASSVPQKYVDLLNKFGGNVTGAKGVDESLLSEACHKHNICKINSDTDLRICFTGAVRKYLTENPEVFDLRKYLGAGKEEVKNLLVEKIKLLGKF